MAYIEALAAVNAVTQVTAGLCGVEILLFCDKVVAECELRKGFSRSRYVSLLAHFLWKAAVGRGMHLVIARAGATSNPLDLPPRGLPLHGWMGFKVEWQWQLSVFDHVKKTIVYTTMH